MNVVVKVWVVVTTNKNLCMQVVRSGEGRFQQEAYMSNFQDQRKANMAISVHEGLAIGIFAIKYWGRYNCLKICPPKMGRHFFSSVYMTTQGGVQSLFSCNKL